MLGVREESQENTGDHAAPRRARRYCLLRKDDNDDTQTLKQQRNYCSWSPSFKHVKNGGKMAICKKYEGLKISYDRIK